jgi:hypothetical protein
VQKFYFLLVGFSVENLKNIGLALPYKK